MLAEPAAMGCMRRHVFQRTLGRSEAEGEIEKLWRRNCGRRYAVRYLWWSIGSSRRGDLLLKLGVRAVDPIWLAVGGLML